MENALPKQRTGDRVMRLPGVCELTCASPATVWRWAKSDPTFPKPFRLSRGVTCWDEGEISAWIEAKKAQRQLNEPSASRGARHA
jgi:predicted DNA-binding transcriptional regulator AlpA